MQSNEKSLIIIKKLKKDGTISDELTERIIDTLLKKEIVIMPVDNIYAAVCLAGPDMEKSLSKVIKVSSKRYVKLISSFKMLDDLADISKSDYDFLNRIWPGEVTVILNSKHKVSADGTIAVRFPKSRYMHTIMEQTSHPLIFANLYKAITKAPVYRKNDIIQGYQRNASLIIIIEELCRRHPRATLVNISKHNLVIRRDGKVSAEEIKSLYFLGSDDE